MVQWTKDKHGKESTHKEQLPAEVKQTPHLILDKTPERPDVDANY